MTLRPCRRAALPALACAAGLAALSSCGSRTGLGVDPSATFATLDGAVDAPSDVRDAAPLPCIPGTFALNRARPAVMFVLDRSGSMGQRLGASTSTRWQVLTRALSATLPPVDAVMDLGAVLYPSAAGEQGCTVTPRIEIEPGPSRVQSLLQRMQATSPNGSTPTADAIEAGAKRLLAYRAAATARSMVLATDGAPNCNASLDPRSCRCVTASGCRRATQCLDDVRTIDRIRGYAAGGLPTFVIGIDSDDGPQFDDVLDAMAVAGGRPRTGATRSYYAAGSEAELEAALVTIREQVGACTYLTVSVPSGGGTITVSAGGVEIPYDESGAQGWRWGDKGNGEIVFFGEACSTAAASAQISANVTCDPPEAGAAPRDAARADALPPGVADASGD